MDEAPLLAADRMLMRLARWLRLLGIDVLTDPSLSGAELLRIARIQGRILLSRDKRLISAPDVHFIASNDLREQLREVIAHFHIDPRARSFTRCSRCNLLLSKVAREVLSRRVPPFVFASHEEFAECIRCGRIYWPATHPERIRTMLNTIGV